MATTAEDLTEPQACCTLWYGPLHHKFDSLEATLKDVQDLWEDRYPDRLALLEDHDIDHTKVTYAPVPDQDSASSEIQRPRLAATLDDDLPDSTRDELETVIGQFESQFADLLRSELDEDRRELDLAPLQFTLHRIQQGQRQAHNFENALSGDDPSRREAVIEKLNADDEATARIMVEFQTVSDEALVEKLDVDGIDTLREVRRETRRVLRKRVRNAPRNVNSGHCKCGAPSIVDAPAGKDGQCRDCSLEALRGIYWNVD